MLKSLISITATILVSVSVNSYAETIEIWSGLEHEKAQLIKREVELQTEHTIEVRSFDIHDLRAELLVARPDESYYPDAIWVPSDFLGLDAHVHFEPIPQEWLEGYQFEPKAMEAVTVGDEIKAIPFAIGNHLILYTRSHAPGVQVTWEYLIEKAKQEGKPSVLFSSPNVYLSVSFYTLFSERSLQDLKLDGESVVASFDFVEQLIKDKVIETNCGHVCAQQKFINGEVDYLIEGDWAFEQLTEELGTALQLMSLPTYQDKPMTSFSGAKVLAITPKSKSSKGKWQLLELIFKGINAHSANSGLSNGLSISPHTAINSQLLKSDDRHFAKLYSTFNQSQMMPSSVEMAIVWEAWGRTLRRYHAGVPKDELARFYEEFVASNLRGVKKGFE